MLATIFPRESLQVCVTAVQCTFVHEGTRAQVEYMVELSDRQNFKQISHRVAVDEFCTTN